MPARPLSIPALRERLTDVGARPVHVTHLLRTWLQARALDRCRGKAPEHYLPLGVRRAWPEIEQELHALARTLSEHPGGDGSTRLLLALHDATTIEAVVLPPHRRVMRAGGKAMRADSKPTRAGTPPRGLCVSTQVGCAVGCTFCKTGEGGLLRQMGSAEIAAQLALARERGVIDKIVFMGMGEPAHNLDAVLEAIDAFGHEGGIGHKNLVLSTVGDARLFERLHARAASRGAAEAAGQVLPALALSLHSTDDAKRRALLPRAPNIAVRELVDVAERYARASGYPLQIQWTLMEGINDGDDEVEALVALLRGRHAILNMIPYNVVDGSSFRRPAPQRCDALFHTLNRRGVLTRLRQSAGQDVEAGCGQLRSRVVATADGVVRGVPPARRASAPEATTVLTPPASNP